MKRRHFLGLSAISATLISTRCFAFSGLTATSPTLISVVLTDVSAHTPSKLLIKSVNELVANGINVTCGLVMPSDRALESRFIQTVLALNALGAGVEFALHLPEFGMKSTYFQSRAAYDSRRRLFDLLDVEGSALHLTTIICDEGEGLIEPTGGRASGFRNILVRPKATQETHSETWPNGIVRFYGGQLVPLVGKFTATAEPFLNENIQLCYLTANSLKIADADQIVFILNELIQSLLGSQVAGQAALISMSDLQLRDDFNFQRFVIIILEIPKGASKDILQNAYGFQDQLKSTGLPSCVKEGDETMWVQRTITTSLTPIVVNYSAPSGSYISTVEPLGFGYGVALSSDNAHKIGIDGCSILHVPTTPLAQSDLSQGAPNQLAGVVDIALTIPPDQIDSPAARASMLSNITALGSDAITVFMDIYDFAEKMSPHGFIEKRHQLTLTARVNERSQSTQKRDEAEYTRLMSDAQRAWAYFEKFTNASTGLCPSTVDGRPDGDILQAATMWDVGSNINALVAATEIGLINEEQLFKFVIRILQNIKGRNTKGINLPPGWIKTDQVRAGDRNFDGCDAGRLLSALNTLRLRYGMKNELDRIVSGWDLQKIIINRQIHSILEGELRSTFSSHCGHYAAVAFRRWGFDVESPYEVFSDHNPADGEMRLLEMASDIGSYGAEPLILEAIELGMSPEGEFLAEVLFHAQKEEFQSSGRLVCVSETPIDQSPWFIYEGLQVGSGTRDWRLNTADPFGTISTSDFEQKGMTFVTKAAFLWAAYKPCEHSTRLLAYARDHAAGKLGFASNVNLKSNTSNLEYTDINSNAIILQSIAFMLRDRNEDPVTLKVNAE